MMILQWPNKDADEVLDYDIDWSQRLAGDTIDTSTWELPPGITQGSIDPSNTTTKTTIWLQGGAEGSRYEILNRITTVGGRTMDQTGSIYIERR